MEELAVTIQLLGVVTIIFGVILTTYFVKVARRLCRLIESVDQEVQDRMYPGPRPPMTDEEIEQYKQYRARLNEHQPKNRWRGHPGKLSDRGARHDVVMHVGVVSVFIGSVDAVYKAEIPIKSYRFGIGIYREKSTANTQFVVHTKSHTNSIFHECGTDSLTLVLCGDAKSSDFQGGNLFERKVTDFVLMKRN